MTCANVKYVVSATQSITKNMHLFDSIAEVLSQILFTLKCIQQMLIVTTVL